MFLLMLTGVMLFMFSMFLLIISMYLYMNKEIYLIEWDLMNLYSMKFSMIIYLDFISMMFISIVLLISFLVLIYSMEYMNLDNNIYRFYYLLILFVLSMCLMILSPSILTILLGWDGLGLISFCLVIYYQSFNSYNSGMLTILCNRIGDIGLLMLICMNSIYGSWNLIFYNMDLVMMVFLLMAIFTKSAQMPFSSWLPAAMMAPTPISSLVHSSTLVTAGIYLLIRYFNLMLLELNYFILYISIFTMFMASLIANFEFDMKKIIALSTLSQLGFMMSILSLGYYELAFFHLIIHALFKSMMFMCSGSFIHNMFNNQDIRNFGKMLNFMPISSIIIIMSLMSLCGFFFLSGFYSKDLIIEYFMIMKFKSILMFMFYLSMIFTLSYSIRLIMWLFFNKFNSFKYLNINENLNMNFCLITLFIFVIFTGWLLNLMIYKNYFIMLDFNDKLLILKMYILGIYFGLIFYFNNNVFFHKVIYFFHNMFFLIMFYKISYVNILNLSYKYEMIVEKSLFESMMSLNIYKIMMFLINSIYKMNNMKIKINLLIPLNMYMFILVYLIMIDL